MKVCDVITYRIPGSIWWRLHISAATQHGDFEDGCGAMYGGLVSRWARRIGPVNIAVLRLR